MTCNYFHFLQTSCEFIYTTENVSFTQRKMFNFTPANDRIYNGMRYFFYHFKHQSKIEEFKNINIVKNLLIPGLYI